METNYSTVTGKNQINNEIPSIEVNSEAVYDSIDDLDAAKYKSAVQRLQIAEAKAKEYESVAKEAYAEAGEMKAKLEEEQIYLETAVRVASNLYRKNTLLMKNRPPNSPTLKPNNSEMGNHTQISENKDENLSEDSISELFSGIEDVYSLASDYDDSKEQITKLKNKVHVLKQKCKQLEDALLEVNDDYVKAAKQNIHNQKLLTLKQTEIKELKESFEVETKVRQRAETYAATMYGKNKAWERKSLLLSLTADDNKLKEALEQIDKLSKELEETKMESQLKIQDLTDALDNQEKVDVGDLEEKLRLLQEQNAQLLDKNEELEKRCAIPPPPPPLSLLPTPPSSSSKLTVAEQVAINKGNNNNENKQKKISSTLPPHITNDMANAMDELFKRIRSGNTGLKQTGAEIFGKDLTPKSPFNHIYTCDMHALKKRLTIKSPRVRDSIKPNKDLVNMRKGLKPVIKTATLKQTEKTETETNQLKSATFSSADTYRKRNMVFLSSTKNSSVDLSSDEGIHPELKEKMERRRKISNVE